MYRLLGWTSPSTATRARAWTGRIGAFQHLTHHLAAVVSFPSRAGVMPADPLPLVAYQVGLRSLQNPLELVSVARLCAAPVDLNSLAQGLQHHCLTVRHLQVVWNGRPLDISRSKSKYTEPKPTAKDLPQGVFRISILINRLLASA